MKIIKIWTLGFELQECKTHFAKCKNDLVDYLDVIEPYKNVTAIYRGG